MRELSSKGPVFVTNHGRETHVLLNVEQFEQLGRGAGRPAGRAEADETDFDQQFPLARWISEGVIVCDDDWRILFVNRVAAAACRKGVAELVGSKVAEAVPGFAGSMLEFQVRRTITANEAGMAEIPSPFSPDSWIRFQSFPERKVNVLMFEDITDEVRRNRVADVRQAMHEVMRVHGGVGFVRLTVRGTIELASTSFCTLLGLAEERILEVPLADLVVVQHRVLFREALEGVLNGREAARITTYFITNHGSTSRADVAMVRLQSAYGTEGAVVLVTPAREGEQDAGRGCGEADGPQNTQIA